jgi:hypothetical protein
MFQAVNLGQELQYFWNLKMRFSILGFKDEVLIYIARKSIFLVYQNNHSNQLLEAIFFHP